MRALLHAHSDYSYDGEPTVEELCTWGSSRGLDLILLTEHVNDFDASKMKRFVDEVDSLSSSRCRLVPGLEFAVRGGFHLLGFNIRSWEPLVEPAEVASFIRDQGGLAVLAHPARYRGLWPDDETLRALHGIEVWNAAYDGRFVPSGNVLAASKARRTAFGHLNFFGGQDMHRLVDHRLIVTESSAETGVDGFLQDLERGLTTFGAAGFRFAGNPPAGSPPTTLLKLSHLSYVLARRVRDRWIG